MITLSIVSHNQLGLVRQLLADLEGFRGELDFEAIVTVNIPEHATFHENDFSFPLTFINNARAKGFGANHNAAFELCRRHFFCVLNPDIRLPENPFPTLLAALQKPSAGLVAPLIIDSSGATEDSARRLPTPLVILKKCFHAKVRVDYPIAAEPFYADWVAGMFILFPSPVFRAAGGFDERYFLYYEDVELCTRLRLAGYSIIIEPSVRVIHLARRDSRRKPRFFFLHAKSMLRFFLSPTFFSAVFSRFKRPSSTKGVQ